MSLSVYYADDILINHMEHGCSVVYLQGCEGLRRIRIAMLQINLFAKDLVDGICGALRDQVISIIVYGSVVRGTNTEESDIDVAVIVKGNLDRSVEDALSDAVVELNLKFDKVFSVIDIDESAYRKYMETSPFYSNVRKEGVVLWKAA